MIIPHALFLPTQESTLLLQSPQQPSQLAHHLAITCPILLSLTHHNRKIENEFIPTVALPLDAYRVADDAVVVNAEGEEAVAELLIRNEVLGYGLEVEEGWRVGGRIVSGGFVRTRNDAIGRDLVEDA